MRARPSSSPPPKSSFPAKERSPTPRRSCARFGGVGFLKWSRRVALAMLALLVATWIITRTSGVTAILSGVVGVYVGEHKVAAYTVRSTVPSQIIHGPMASRAHGWSPWTFDFHCSRSRVGAIIPFWALVLLAVSFAAYAHVRLAFMARSRSGVCVHCRYSRNGLAQDAPCPECGAASTRAPADIPHRDHTSP